MAVLMEWNGMEWNGMEWNRIESKHQRLILVKKISREGEEGATPGCIDYCGHRTPITQNRKRRRLINTIYENAEEERRLYSITETHGLDGRCCRCCIWDDDMTKHEKVQAKHNQ